MAGQLQSSIDLTQSDDEHDEVTDLTELPESDDDIFAGPAHKKAAAKKTDVTDLTRSSDGEKPAAPIDLSRAVVIGVVGLPTTVLDTTTARYGPPPMPSVAAAALHGLQQQPMSLHEQRIVMGGSASGSRTVMPHTSPQAVASLASAGGQTIVTAAPAQGAAGGAASGAASVGGMNVFMSGGFGAASSATESDDEAPIPAMASTSPQAVASCARMSASSAKPAKKVGKGKRKAPDRMEGSAKKPKTSSDWSASCDLKKLVENAQRWNRKYNNQMVVNKENKHDWIKEVSDWFEERKALCAFLDIKDLKSPTVQMMVKFEAANVTQVMDKCAVSPFKKPPQDMQEFNTRVYDMLERHP